jgi:uncharacterized protein (TIGR03435 family)
MMRPSFSFLVAGKMSLTLPIAFALVHATQTPAQPLHENTAASLPKYEAASVRPHTTDDLSHYSEFTPDGFHARNASVRSLLEVAFGFVTINEDSPRILNTPGWARRERYDIRAKVDGADVPRLQMLSVDQQRQMVQVLMADRFDLKFHHETRDLPSYVLVVAKGGSKLKASSAGLPGPYGSPDPRGPSAQPRMFSPGEGQLEAHGIPIRWLIGPLSRELGDRTVVDKTGLTESYNFSLHWASDKNPAPEVDAPSLFTALQEQIGLKLEAQKTATDVIVVDRIEKPSEN